jgi:hypothetical protein
MMRFNLRRVSRRLSTSLAFMLVFAIFSGVITEFFIELGKERGWYDKPSERLIAGMTDFSDFVTQTWFLVAAAFLTGFAAGLWTDFGLRRQEAALAIDATPPRLALSGQPGHLDYVVEGVQSFNDVTTIFRSASRDTKNITQTIALYSWILKFVNNFAWKRKFTSRLAAKLIRFSEKMSDYAPRIAEVRKRTHENCLALIECTPILNQATLDALVQFANALYQSS